MIIRPKEKVGTRTPGMVVVICPACKLPAWANLSRPGLPVKDGTRKANTVCCGSTVTVGDK